MLNRRETLLGAGVLAAAPALALAQTPSTTADAALDLLFDQFMQEGFQQRPEAATQLGVDKGAMAPLKSRLSDVSAAGRAANRALTQDQLRLLRAVDRSALSPSGQVNYDTILYTRESAAAIQAFPFGGASYGPSPYVVSQLTGAYQAVPDFLDTKHKIELRWTPTPIWPVWKPSRSSSIRIPSKCATTPASAWFRPTSSSTPPWRR
jgi:uncharacterized protein (DUF885 family)